MASDQKFFDIYSLVVGALALFAVFILIFALWLGDATQGQFVKESPEYKQAIVDRIAPVGKAFLPGEERVVQAPVVETVAEPEPVMAALSGPQVYNQACLACHGAGIGGAPIPGDADVWTARIAQGIDVLYDHAINGYQGDVGYMPAKGGRVDLSDDEVAAAVDYMVAESS
ncbi:MAG: c-type cytochrome [Pseudomonadota bacterium]